MASRSRKRRSPRARSRRSRSPRQRSRRSPRAPNSRGRSRSPRQRSRRSSRARSRSGSSGSPSPSDPALYNRVKARVYSQNPKHSAYRSGMVVKAYKQAFSKKHGSSRSPYRGSRRSGSLSRWFKEKWVNQRGEVGYKYKSDIYRPSVRVNRRTPKTHRELSPSALKKARQQKARTGRVKRF
jgi:hypothetical protein